MCHDPLTGLLALRQQTSRRIIGLMSGTSGDGIDVAVVDISGHGVHTSIVLEHFETVPLSANLKRRVWGLPDGKASGLCELNFLLGEAFADAALSATTNAGITLESLDLVGSHGQTARHQPPSGDSRRGSTLQIGEGAVIAERLGVPVICDFRVADVAAGGQGAPLIPLVDYLLFRHPTQTRILLNLGGIANLTVVPPKLDAVTAFDTGPANMALDAVARAASGGFESFDRNGELAAKGQVDNELLERLLKHPYFKRCPPKSTGRELFGRDFTYPLLDRYHRRLGDLMATLVALTVETVAQAIEGYVYPKHKISTLWISGGGVHNPCVLNGLKKRLAPLETASLGESGLDPDAKEAVGFALLANETLFGSPGNVPGATGARGARILGKFALPSGG